MAPCGSESSMSGPSMTGPEEKMGILDQNLTPPTNDVIDFLANDICQLTTCKFLIFIFLYIHI